MKSTGITIGICILFRLFEKDGMPTMDKKNVRAKIFLPLRFCGRGAPSPCIVFSADAFDASLLPLQGVGGLGLFPKNRADGYTVVAAAVVPVHVVRVEEHVPRVVRVVRA